MTNYADALQSMTERAGTIRLRGKLVQRHPFGDSIVIHNPGCLCVHAEGCPCDDLGGTIVIIQRTTVTGNGELEQEADGAEPAIWVDVERDAKVKVLEVTALSVGAVAAYSKHGVAMANVTVGGGIAGFLANVAFKVGQAAGKHLDDKTGVSDDVSDWAAESFRAPGWLQDLF